MPIINKNIPQQIYCLPGYIAILYALLICFAVACKDAKNTTHYLTPKRIVFRITTYNKKDGSSCELSDSASITASLPAVPN
jgi:hypothetical protein